VLRDQHRRDERRRLAGQPCYRDCKAETANDFSNSGLALSTANLYAPTQPGGSLYGLTNSNPFNPFFSGPIAPTTQNKLGIRAVPAGIITFGGGVALYSNGKVIGGLGVSGDSSCADHAIAYRMRRTAGFDHLPGEGQFRLLHGRSEESLIFCGVERVRITCAGSIRRTGNAAPIFTHQPPPVSEIQNG